MTTPLLLHCSGTDLLLRQLGAVQRWTELRHEDQQRALAPATRSSCEHALELCRRAAALDVEAAALREHCTAGEHRPRTRRVVLIHRNPWLVGKLHTGLTDLGIHVAAVAVDGAAGCGIAIAEAPELVLLEANLPSMTGQDVTHRIRRCSPTTLIAAQVPHTDDTAALLKAGAAAAWPRHIRLDDLVAGLNALLRPPVPLPLPRDPLEHSPGR